MPPQRHSAPEENGPAFKLSWTTLAGWGWNGLRTVVVLIVTAIWHDVDDIKTRVARIEGHLNMAAEATRTNTAAAVALKSPEKNRKRIGLESRWDLPEESESQ